MPPTSEFTTRLNRPWLMKMAIFTVVLIGFGFYGLYDAMVAYPGRGERFASYAQWEYLEIASEQGLLSRELSVVDPVAELRRLRDMPTPNPQSAAKRVWLESLEVIGQLRPERTKIDDPYGKLTELRSKWKTDTGARAAPKPLSWYDIPVQWVFVAVGFGGAAWLGALWLMVARQRYQWNPATLTLTLPGGQTIAAEDLDEPPDKRKWDKYLVFLKVKAPHPLAGREIKLDLYRYAPLEAWVLQMGEAAFPEQAAEAAPAAEPETAQA